LKLKQQLHNLLFTSPQHPLTLVALFSQQTQVSNLLHLEKQGHSLQQNNGFWQPFLASQQSSLLQLHLQVDFKNLQILEHLNTFLKQAQHLPQNSLMNLQEIHFFK
jgi:hypothetical protein